MALSSLHHPPYSLASVEMSMKESPLHSSESSISTPATSKEELQESATKRQKHKKRHTFGVYPCDYPDCNKVFQRSDHLARHKLIHDSSSKIFVCSWSGCGRKFNRSDTMKLHYNRHLKKLTSTGDTSNVSSPSNTEAPQRDDKRALLLLNSNPSFYSSILESTIPLNEQLFFKASVNNGFSKEGNNKARRKNTSLVSTGYKQEPPLQPSDILNILFPEEPLPPTDYSPSGYTEYVEGTGGDFESNTNIEQHFHSLFDPSQNVFLNKMSSFPMSPSDLTTARGSQTYIDQNIMQRMLIEIPSLALIPDFNVSLLQRSLEIFWSLYSYRLSILHKPSFDTRGDQPVLLLLAMVMMGAALSHATDQIETVFTNPQKLAEEIAIPLRWALFQSPELTSPRSWIIQSLMILECFEKHLSTRELFQRSSIHHSTKVQILRRSTTLGGDPYRKDNFESEALWRVTNKSSQLWNKWIELESMKRSAYATFVIDSHNAVLTNQPIALYAHQLKLSLPCNEQLWLTLNFDQELLKNFEWVNQSYISAFIDMVNEKETAASEMSPILLSGIITLISLFQNTSSMKFPVSVVNESWRDMLTYCLESWLINVRKGCTSIHDLSEKLVISRELNATSHYCSPQDHRCKAPIYHLAHVTLRLSNFDWMMYSGSPLLTNIRAECTDFETVCMRVRRWSGSKEGGVSVVNAYLLLIETLLPSKEDDPATFKPYDPKSDLLYERPYCLGQLALIVWCYNYSSKGPESGFLDNEMNYTFYLNDMSSIDKHVKEDGYAYLNRIKETFHKEDTKFDKLVQTELSSSIDKQTPEIRTQLYHRRIQMYENALSALRDSHHIAGFMLMLSKMYLQCSNWDLCLEMSRLMKHCQSRSMGNKEVKCLNMYNSN